MIPNLDELLDWFPDKTRKIVEALPDQQRRCVLLVIVWESTEAEAAKILGVSRRTVNAHIYQAKQQLKKMFKTD